MPSRPLGSKTQVGTLHQLGSIGHRQCKARTWGRCMFAFGRDRSGIYESGLRLLGECVERRVGFLWLLDGGWGQDHRIASRGKTSRVRRMRAEASACVQERPLEAVSLKQVWQ